MTPQLPITSFPAIYVSDLERSVRFYSSLGFEEDYRFPPGPDAGYAGMHRDSSRLGIVERTWPEAQLGFKTGDGPRFELWVYVDDVDATIESLRKGGTRIMKGAEDMPWGERLGYVADPDGNPVAIAHRP
jgi:lactoylglutathione lyase